MRKIHAEPMKAQPLENVARFIRGITFTPEDKVTPGTEGSTVCMRTANVQDVLDESDLIAVPLEFVKRDEQFLMESDILVSTANSWNLVGKCSWVPKLNFRATAGGFISILRADKSKVFPRYLYYWFASDKTQHDVRLCGRQTTNISNMSFERCLALEIPLPPLLEQKRIADILDKADSIRRKRQEASELADTFQQGLFCEMFGDPISNEMAWPVKSFGEMASNQDGRRKPVKASDREKVSGEYPYYGASGIIDYVDSYLFDETALLIGEDGANLLARSTPIAFLATGKYWVNNHAHVVTPNGTATLLYIATHLNMRSIRDFITGSAQPKLNQANLNNIPIPCPPMVLQEEFDRRIHAFAMIRKKQNNADKEVESIFNSLVQRAFKGEL
jgi:type I restriction enzyme S subunit